MAKEKRVELKDVIEQEIDECLADYESMGEPIELSEEQRSSIVLIIDKYLGEELQQQITNALF